MKPSIFRRSSWCSGLALLGALTLAGSAIADELQDAKALLQEGKLTEALVKTNKLIDKKPGDPAAQFVKGLILSEQKKTPEAIEIFSRLTTEHPDFPEPYNNLAVLFATEGHFAKARIALETALKLNPYYATAQENLGDVFLQSALQSYAEAARSDGESRSLKNKLRNVRTTLGLAPNDPGFSGRTAAAPVPALAAAAPAAAGSSEARDKKKDATQEATKGGPGEREVVLRVVDQWVRAWSNKDVKAYFSLYADDFRPPHGESRSAWEKTRRERISNKDQIDIQVVSPSVTITAGMATVNFQQIYLAGKVSSNGRKSLTLKNEGGNWKILQEKSES